MTTFALVHGGMHGAWCWDLLAPELAAAGHEVVAPDLPCDQPVGAAVYARVVLDALDAAGHGTDPDVVLVAHSLMGAVVPLVASARPLRRAVFLCAIVPDPGRALGEVAAEQVADPGSRLDVALNAVDAEGRLVPTGFEAAVASLYADCPEAVARWAYERLRPQSMVPLEEVAEDLDWSGTPTDVVVCADDRMAPPGWLRRTARERLGVEPVELPGGHSPFLSRPAELARLLIDRT